MTYNFSYHVPTRIYFGDQISQQLGQELKKHGHNVLLMYGSERLKTLSLYQTILEQTKELNLFELGGVEPNPRHSTVNKAATICKEKHIDVILAVGGGSVVDCAKLTSPAAFYSGNCWDLVTGKAPMERFLPIVTIPTISGTGTDMDAFGIVSNQDTLDKLPFFHPQLYPVASFLDPTQTFTVSKFQTACGAIDAFSHYLEVYFMRPNLDAHLRCIEGFMKSILKALPIVLEHPNDYESRASIMWASSWALSGFTFGPTKGTPFMCHWIEDEISAKYDITHGLGLAIILPHYLDYCLNEQSAPLYAELGTNVLDLPQDCSPQEIGKKCIQALQTLFFSTCGLPKRLRDCGVSNTDKFPEMARIACRNCMHGFVDLNQEDVINILTASF
ncbi:MAG: iron-containing alcohol dehydrogenase [Desulfovibrionaceae bacterium]|nr:iron-containing alcohol dehydrogenase [Desulfovibrionaceae bacterium]